MIGKNNNPYSVDKILIAEDHDLYGDGLALVLQEFIPSAQIYRARDFQSALNMLDKNPDINLVMLDMKMPGATGLEGIKAVKLASPTLIIIVISSLDFDTNIRNIIDLGVNGFIAKSTTKKALIAGIKRVLEGDIVIESESTSEHCYALSERQLQTLSYMAQGKTNKEIARALNISPHTAKEYVSKVIQCLGAENRTQAVQTAERTGLLLNFQ